MTWMTDWDSPQIILKREIFVSLFLYLLLDVNPKWSGVFCLTVELNIKTKLQFQKKQNKNLLFSVYKIKINIGPSEDSKPSEQNRIGGKRKSMSQRCTGLSWWAPLSVPLCWSNSHFLFNVFCCLFYWLCSVSMNQCERHKVVEGQKWTLDTRCWGI